MKLDNPIYKEVHDTVCSPNKKSKKHTKKNIQIIQNYRFGQEYLIMKSDPCCQQQGKNSEKRQALYQIVNIKKAPRPILPIRNSLVRNSRNYSVRNSSVRDSSVPGPYIGSQPYDYQTNISQSSTSTPCMDTCFPKCLTHPQPCCNLPNFPQMNVCRTEGNIPWNVQASQDDYEYYYYEDSSEKLPTKSVSFKPIPKPVQNKSTNPYSYIHTDNFDIKGNYDYWNDQGTMIYPDSIYYSKRSTSQNRNEHQNMKPQQSGNVVDQSSAIDLTKNASKDEIKRISNNSLRSQPEIICQNSNEIKNKIIKPLIKYSRKKCLDFMSFLESSIMTSINNYKSGSVVVSRSWKKALLTQLLRLAKEDPVISSSKDLLGSMNSSSKKYIASRLLNLAVKDPEIVALIKQLKQRKI